MRLGRIRSIIFPESCRSLQMEIINCFNSDVSTANGGIIYNGSDNVWKVEWLSEIKIFFNHRLQTCIRTDYFLSVTFSCFFRCNLSMKLMIDSVIVDN